MLKMLHLSYAMTRLYRAVHRAQNSESETARAQAARWVCAWNAFIQSGLKQLQAPRTPDVPYFGAEMTLGGRPTLH